jgi:lipopolysaccharide export system protein LptC
MYGRPTILFPLALLALLALLTLWIDRSVQTPEPKAPGIDRHDPDYFLNNFVTSKTDTNGSLKYMLAAVTMTHYPDDDSTTLERPRFTQYGIDKPYTQIEGQKGLVSSNGDTVEFMDNVKVVRQAFQDRGEMVVLTDYMKVFPKKDLATTDRPVVITQAPKTVIHATGMIYDKAEQTVTLLSRVRAHYEKPIPPAGKAKPKTKKSAGASKAPSNSTLAKTGSAKTTPAKKSGISQATGKSSLKKEGKTNRPQNGSR